MRDFANAEIAPYAAQWDLDHTFPTNTVQAMGDLGLFGLIFPEEYGGAGADFTTLCIAIEEIGRVDQSLGITLEAGVCLGAKPIFEFGSDAQKHEYLPDLVAGQALAGFGLTEPDAGSDAGATKTRAALDTSGGQPHWVIDGSKCFITNSGTEITSLVTVTARTTEGISTLIVPSGTAGFVVEPAYHKMGWHASDTHGLRFDGCRVPESNLLGAPGRGFQQFLATLDDGRIAIAALAVGADPSLSRRMHGVRESADCVRQADRQQPSSRVQVRRHGGSCGNGSTGDLRGGGAQRRRTAVQEGSSHCQALRDRGSRFGDPRSDADLRRVRLHRTKPQWRGSTAMRRSWRSAKAQARSSES